MAPEKAVSLLASLAQTARLTIFRTLVQAGKSGLAAGHIAEKLSIPTSTLSFHLKELNQAGLITAKPEGRFIYYVANYATMDALIHYLTENCCQGATETTDQDSCCEVNTRC